MEHRLDASKVLTVTTLSRTPKEGLGGSGQVEAVIGVPGTTQKSSGNRRTEGGGRKLIPQQETERCLYSCSLIS